MKRRAVKKKNGKVFTLVIGMLIGLLFSYAFQIASGVPKAGALSEIERPAYVDVLVKEGDTIWNLAKKHTSENDIRKTIYNIKKANNLSTADIYPGQLLKIPQI